MNLFNKILFAGGVFLAAFGGLKAQNYNLEIVDKTPLYINQNKSDTFDFKKDYDYRIMVNESEIFRTKERIISADTGEIFGKGHDFVLLAETNSPKPKDSTNNALYASWLDKNSIIYLGKNNGDNEFEISLIKNMEENNMTHVGLEDVVGDKNKDIVLIREMGKNIDPATMLDVTANQIYCFEGKGNGDFDDNLQKVGDEIYTYSDKDRKVYGMR